MTDTIKPPSRPKSPKPQPAFGRGGDKPRTRPPESRRSSAQRPGEPAPREDDARIAKVMARAGLCSRRDAESWIAAGRVAVNGTVIDSPALNVKAEDRITIDGVSLPEREPTRLFMFHKPRGLVTTSRDPEGRPTIFEHLPEALPRVVSVGRLDINTEGLMLVTNDGGLARLLELPATGWMRRYRVRANGEIDQARLDTLKGGITVDGVDYAGIEATLDRVQGSNAWLTMGLREGKNREIKRVLESLGLGVTRLIRISFGPFQLGDLAEGAVEAVPSRVLRDQLGPGLMAEAGVDLDNVEERAQRHGGRAAPEPLAEARPSRSNPPPPRAHVSALRASREEAAQQGRRRIERGATADRKGRAVKVERVIPVGPGSERADSGTRNARRFAGEKQNDAAGRQNTRGNAERGTGSAGSRARSGADARPARNRPGREPRAEHSKGFDDRPRGERGADPSSKPRGERAASYGDKPRGERAAGFTGKPRGERATGFNDKPRGGGFGGKPAGGRASGSKAASGKPGGRTGGFGSERPATGRNRPSDGARPTGPGRAPGGNRPAGSDRPTGGGRPPRGRS